MSATAFLAVLFLLPESLDQRHRDELRSQPRVGFFAALKKVSARPLILQILCCGMIFSSAAGLVETIFPIWVKDLGLIDGPRGMIAIFLCAGLVMAIVQGGLIGPLTKKLREHRLIKIGAVCYAVGMFCVTLAGDFGNYYFVVFAMTAQTASMALIVTPLQSLISQCASDTERGMVMGLHASMSTLGRAMGPLLTGVIYANIHHHGSMYGAMMLAAIALMIAFLIERRWLATAAA